MFEKFKNKSYLFQLLLTVVFFILVLPSIKGEILKNGSVWVPIRGNALDIHFYNLTKNRINCEPAFYTNKNKKISPKLERRNLLFIPNEDKANSKKRNMPVSFQLTPAKIISNKKKTGIAAKKFIQSVLIYNNINTYSKDILNYEYNSESRTAPFSSFIWTNGTRTRTDGLYAFKNAMEEINNLSYKVSIKLNDGRELSFKLKLNSSSDIKEKKKLKHHKPGVAAMADDITVLIYTAAGTISMAASPAVSGGLILLGDATWGVASLADTLNEDYQYSKYTPKNTEYSWLSSPFDLLVYPKDYWMKNKKGEKVETPEFDKKRCRLTYYLGKDHNPETIVVQISASRKGDLKVYIISGSLFDTKKIKNFLKTEEFKRSG